MAESENRRPKPKLQNQPPKANGPKATSPKPATPENPVVLETQNRLARLSTFRRGGRGAVASLPLPHEERYGGGKRLDVLPVFRIMVFPRCYSGRLGLSIPTFDNPALFGTGIAEEQIQNRKKIQISDVDAFGRKKINRISGKFWLQKWRQTIYLWGWVGKIASVNFREFRNTF